MIKIPEITKNEVTVLEYKLLNNPEFKAEFLKEPFVESLAESWLKAPSRQTNPEDNLTIEDARDAVYEMVVWDLNRADGDRIISIDDDFWNHVKRLVRTHLGWVTVKMGNEFVRIINSDKPEKFFDRPEVTRLCCNRISELFNMSVSGKHPAIREMKDDLYILLKGKVIKKPGAIFGKIHSILRDKYAYHGFAAITEEYDIAANKDEDKDNKTYSHLTIEILNQSKLDSMYGKTWYEDNIKENHRQLVIGYYSGTNKKDVGKNNELIKNSLKLSIKDMPLSIYGFHYDATKDEPVSFYKGPSAKLRDLLTKEGIDLPEDNDDRKQEEKLDSMDYKSSESNSTISDDEYNGVTDWEAKDAWDRLNRGIQRAGLSKNERFVLLYKLFNFSVKNETEIGEKMLAKGLISNNSKNIVGNTRSRAVNKKRDMLIASLVESKYTSKDHECLLRYFKVHELEVLDHE